MGAKESVYAATKAENGSSSKEDDLIISTWSNGQLIDRSNVKVMLPISESQESTTKLVANANQVDLLVKTFLSEENQTYKEYFQACTAKSKDEKATTMLKHLLSSDEKVPPRDSFTWQEAAYVPSQVRIIHKRREEFCVPLDNFPLKGTLCEFLKDE